MTTRTLRAWLWIHKWSSLVCTLFMLLLCLTGLPLIFHHEIAHLTGDHVVTRAMPADTPRANLDRVLDAARARHPGWAVQFLSREEDDDTFWYVTLGETPSSDREKSRFVAVDARTAEVIAQPRFDEGFMHVMFKLHVDLFAGLPGTLFLGFMGLLLVAAIASGAVIYAPFMRKLEFGTVRRERPRTRWLDLHNLLGIVTLVWATVVAATGVINTLAQPMFAYWQDREMAGMIAPYKGLPPPRALGPLHEAVRGALAHEAGMKLSFVAFPGGEFSSPHHYAVYLRGDTPFTSKLLKPVLVDARTSAVTDSRELPWFLTVLLVSQPLHFGDYGGMPMKILWALLDVLTLVVLGSGVYLWVRKRRRGEEGIAAPAAGEGAA